MLHKRIFGLVLLIALALIFQQNANACSCAGKPTVLEAFESSEVVIIAKVVALDNLPADGAETSGQTVEPAIDDDDSFRNYQSARMVVEKIYKGSVKIGEELTFAQGGGADCVWTYDRDSIGDRYLLYLDKPSKGRPGAIAPAEDAALMYYAFSCGRSTGADDAFDDLLFLNNLEKVRGRSRISGTFSAWRYDSPSGANMTVKIIGKTKTYTAKTDKNGVFEIYDLPAGLYYIEPKMPLGWKLGRGSEQIFDDTPYSKNRMPVFLKEKRHAGVDLEFEIDNAIRGKVLSPTGKPLKNVCIYAASVESEEKEEYSKSDCTGDKGEFEITELSAGNYYLIVNRDGKIDDTEPFGKLYYPGVTERKNAAVVAVSAGKFLSGINIQISQMVELIEISGQFLYADGQPVSKEDITFVPEQRDLYASIEEESSAQGRFTIRIPKGASGKIYGEKRFYTYDVTDCPKIKQLTEAADTPTLKTNEIAIDGSQNLQDVKLIFPFPFCPKPKE